jgi:DNA-binding CsgD family transcriptional regulator
VPVGAFATCCRYGIVAVIGLHRSDPAATRTLLNATARLARAGDRMIGSLTLANSLEREQAGEPGEALAVLLEGLAKRDAEIEQTTDLLADAVRLALLLADTELARELTLRAESAVGLSAAFHRKAVGLHCRGLLDNDPEKLLEAAGQYERAPRPLLRAQALEAAGAAYAADDDVSTARDAFTQAYALYLALGALWDLARLQARFRGYGIRRGPRFQHRRSRQGWDSLTPAERKVVRLVARGMSNPQIAAQLFLSRRTVQTHVSHVLAKLELSSRTEIAREAGQNGYG